MELHCNRSWHKWRSARKPEREREREREKAPHLRSLHGMLPLALYGKWAHKIDPALSEAPCPPFNPNPQDWQLGPHGQHVTVMRMRHVFIYIHRSPSLSISLPLALCGSLSLSLSLPLSLSLCLALFTNTYEACLYYDLKIVVIP